MVIPWLKRTGTVSADVEVSVPSKRNKLTPLGIRTLYRRRFMAIESISLEGASSDFYAFFQCGFRIWERSKVQMKGCALYTLSDANESRTAEPNLCLVRQVVNLGQAVADSGRDPAELLAGRLGPPVTLDFYHCAEMSSVPWRHLGELFQAGMPLERHEGGSSRSDSDLLERQIELHAGGASWQLSYGPNQYRAQRLDAWLADFWTWLEELTGGSPLDRPEWTCEARLAPSLTEWVDLYD